MAMSLSLAVTAGAATLGDYSDSEQVTAKYATAVDFASQLGILEGFDDGKYHPQGTLTRAQLATMVYRMTTADVADVYTANFAGGAAEAFSDTAATARYAGYVGYAADAELLKGLGDGTYAPNSALTGYAALAAFLRGVGYDEPGYNFVGADWTVEVAKVAKQVGALEGITNVDLNKPITREVAAQMIYNIMFSDMVAYTPAFGYQEGILGAGDTLAKDEFEIETGKDGKIVNVAPWGRIATEWYYTDKDVAVSIAAAPVATFKTAVTECDMSTAVGEKDNWTAYYWLNGDMASSKVTIEAKDTKNDVLGTDQGTLTEVYAYENNGKTVYEIVEIETWLGLVGDVVKATYDKAGHLDTKAMTDVTVYGADWNIADMDTEAFAEESYVLVQKTDWAEDHAKYDGETYFLTATAPVATAELKSYNSTTEQSVLGTTTYDWAAKYALNNPGTTKNTYNVFVDQYGNLIGLVTPDTIYSYGIITEMAWANSTADLLTAKAYANVMDFTASVDKSVVMAGVDNGDNGYEKFNSADKAILTPAKLADCTVSTIVENNGDYYDTAYKFETLSDGSKVINAVGKTLDKGATIDIVKEKPTNVASGINTNDDTVVAVLNDAGDKAVALYVVVTG